MKKVLLRLLAPLVLTSSLTLSGCKKEAPETTITFATEAMYPPFDYMKEGQLTGFDIELARAVARELGKEAAFENMEFKSILAAVDHGQVEAAIATLTITPERQATMDFSTPYYVEGLVVVFRNSTSFSTVTDLDHQKVACQLGSTMESWLKEHVPTAERIVFDNNNQAIEALKAGHVDAVVIDTLQGKTYSAQNPGLGMAPLAMADNGYGIAVKKGSPLLHQINAALQKLEASGELKALQDKWLSA